MKHATIKEKESTTFSTFKDSLGYKNALQAPRLVKVVLSAGTGKTRGDKRRDEVVSTRLAKLAGQKAAPRSAKKSIAGFKVREGDVVGYATTLRGQRMYGFLDKFFNIVLPRTRDFKGIEKKSVDVLGNLTIGVREHTVFPEVSDEDLKDVFGLAVTLVTTAKSKAEALKFFEHIGVPFKKDESKK